MHLIRLVNATFYAHHGCTPEEQHTGGRYEVDVEVKFDFQVAARKDDVHLTVCYEEIYRIVKTIVMEYRFALIERMAYLISEQVRELSDKIAYAEVVVRKRNPPIDGTADYAEVVYRSVPQKMSKSL